MSANCQSLTGAGQASTLPSVTSEYLRVLPSARDFTLSLQLCQDRDCRLTDVGSSRLNWLVQVHSHIMKRAAYELHGLCAPSSANLSLSSLPKARHVC